MNAAIVTAPNTTPIFGTFQDPTPQPGLEILTVRAAALTNLTKGRAAGSHYSAADQWPIVPGTDGVGLTAAGQRVYFAMPEAPFGAMAEQTLVHPARLIPVPDSLDDVAAAALANPGMSCFAALVDRARLQPGETVLINGATGSSGSVAVQVAKHLGAKKVIATGRNRSELESLRALGADVLLPLPFTPNSPEAEHFEQALEAEFAQGLDVVLDYLWGSSARSILVGIAKAVEDAHPVRFIQIGESSREPLDLPAAALRSSAVQLMGSGLKSIPFPRLLQAIRSTFTLAATSTLHLPTTTAPLASIAETWNSPGKPRLVYTLP